MASAIDNLPDSLKCPVCFELPKDRVFQCTEGHIICELCYIQVPNCPQCRKEYGRIPIRCRAIEEMLGNLKLANGSGLRRQKDICEYIGHEGCSFMVNEGNADDTFRHLKTVHGFSVTSGPLPYTYRNYKKFRNFSKSFDSGTANKPTWLLHLAKPEKSYALIWEIKWEPAKKAFYFMCNFFKNSSYSLKQPPNIKFTISSRKNHEKFVFTLPANDFLDIDDEMFHRMVISAKTLINKYDIDSTMCIKIEVLNE